MERSLEEIERGVNEIIDERGTDEFGMPAVENYFEMADVMLLISLSYCYPNRQFAEMSMSN